MNAPNRQERLTGVLLGTAVGDALGLPREGLSPERAQKLFGGAPRRYQLLPGRGLCSDDTEHACMVAQALLASVEPDEFARDLAWRLRWWLLGFPAGTGLATLGSTFKLWMGVPPQRSGIHSAGNGAAMRAAILGACIVSDSERLPALVRASSRITHTDPRAEQGALAIARAAGYAVEQTAASFDPQQGLAAARAAVEDAELRKALDTVGSCLEVNAPPAEMARSLGLDRGVTGFINHTLPAALYCWLRTPRNFRTAVEDVILLGGDTDSTAAIVGGLAGALLGEGAIPVEWIQGLREWPRSAAWMRGLGRRLALRFPADGKPESPGPAPLFWPAVAVRNLAFNAVVLAHGFRRTLPPY